MYKIQIVGIPVTLPEGIIFMLLAAAFVKYKDVFKFDFKEFAQKNKVILIAVLLILLGAVLSFFVTQASITLVDGQEFSSLRVALGIFKSWIVAPIIYFVLLKYVLNKDDLKKSLNVYALSAAVLSIWAVWQLATGNYVTVDMRASGPFISANYLALYLGPALVFLTVKTKEVFLPSTFLEGKDAKKIPFLKKAAFKLSGKDIFYSVAFIVCLIAMIATKSYAALFAYVIAVSFYYFIEFVIHFKANKKARLPWASIVSILVIAIVAAIIVYYLDVEKWQSVFNFTERNSSSVRLEVYAITWSLIKNNFLFGIGMGSFEALYQTQAVNILERAPLEWVMLHPHNFYFAMWLNLGILGLGGLGVIIYVAIKELLAMIKKIAGGSFSQYSSVVLIGMAMFVAILMHGLIDTPFFKNDLALIFWLVVAVFSVREKV
ncbi:hypothetical protein GF340_02675 [Candidatus Peregrinibacteria bacterium]|nr:hypothetical protein [Candidatus Peregrinibacteria bacterium]